MVVVAADDCRSSADLWFRCADEHYLQCCFVSVLPVLIAVGLTCALFLLCDMIGGFSVMGVSLLRRALGSGAWVHFSPLAFSAVLFFRLLVLFLSDMCINKDCKKIQYFFF